MKYADAYALAHPFDPPVPALAETEQAQRLADEAVALAFRAIEAGRLLALILNNRAWGSAPELAREVASSFLDLAETRGARIWWSEGRMQDTPSRLRATSRAPGHRGVLTHNRWRPEGDPRTSTRAVP